MKNVLCIHIKILRGNYFLLISNQLGKLIFSKNCGDLGFTNIKKRTKDAFQSLLLLGTQYLLNLDNNYKLFIKIEGAKKIFLQLIYQKFINLLKSYHFYIFTIKLINKISHNGCRKSYFRK